MEDHPDRSGISADRFHRRRRQSPALLDRLGVPTNRECDGDPCDGLWQEGTGDTVCQHCGAENVTWFAPSKLWNLVVGGPDATDDPGGVLCIPCFIRRAEVCGIKPSAWLISPELPSSAAPAGPRHRLGGRKTQP